MTSIQTNLILPMLRMLERKPTKPDRKDQEAMNQQLRHLLVAIMSLSLRYWSQTMQKSKLELAEESKIWNVYIDAKGTFRTQTLDRYFNTSTLPKNPRWHNVLQTAYYVLQSCPDSAPEIKKELQLKVMDFESLLQTRA